MAYKAPKGWEAVIGLEIHAQLSTQTKLFSTDSTEFGCPANEATSAVSLGLPGALPSLNKLAVSHAMKAGLALGCEINTKSVFARKHYFYPDLPKGYQISQFDKPICENGSVEFYVGKTKKTVHIERAHLEEDAGKSTHHGGYSLINYNRSGVPLLEIVSGPNMHTPEEAAEYARTIRGILRYLEVCDGNLEEGSLRCDCNVSVRPVGEKTLRTRAEIKNVNSFRFVEKAIEYEIFRQVELYKAGDAPVQETRLYDSAKNRTQSMRAKEEAKDYRYFTDPDLLPVQIEESWLKKVKESLPELPIEKSKRFVTQYEIPEYDALILTGDLFLAHYFEEAAKITGDPKLVSNWIMGEMLRLLKENDLEVEKTPISSKNLADLLSLVQDSTVSGKIAKQVFKIMWETGGAAKDIVKDKNLAQISDPEEIKTLVMDVLKQNAEQVEQYKSGKDRMFGFFVGQIMKNSQGKANPEILNEVLKIELNNV